MDIATEADTVKWLGGAYQSVSLMATTDTINSRPQTVQKMTNALVKALRYIANQGAAEIAATSPEDVTGKDKTLLSTALQHGMSMFPRTVS